MDQYLEGKNQRGGDKAVRSKGKSFSQIVDYCFEINEVFEIPPCTEQLYLK